jgi:hypothetical protein
LDRKRKRKTLAWLFGTGGIVGEPGPIIKVAGSRTILESASNPTVLGAITVDNDGGHSWTVTVDVDADNKFDINSGNLRMNSTLNYETKQNHQVTLRGQATGQPDITRTFTYFVQNVIENPVWLSPPEISGTALIGSHLLMSVPGELESPDGDAATIAYQWFLVDGPTEISGETDPDHFDSENLSPGDEVFLRATATNVAGSTSEDSNSIGPFLEPDEEETSLLWGDEGYLTIMHMGL